MCWFSDEPTTGMDPKIRRNIWNMIIKKKTNRVIIMTTHSMEEADILGDSIAILANGYLRLIMMGGWMDDSLYFHVE